MTELLQRAAEDLIDVRQRISTDVNSLSAYITSMNLEARIGGSAWKLRKLQMIIRMLARSINHDILYFEGLKRQICKGLLICADYARTRIEAMPDDLEVDLPMASSQLRLETDDRLPVLTDHVRRGIEEMLKLEAEAEDRLVNDMASAISHFKNMDSILIYIEEYATAGETSSLKGSEESYKEELVAFEAIKFRIVQTMLNISDALIKDIEPQRKHVERAQGMLDLPSKEIPHNLPPNGYAELF
ncbi:unnamed protein product [Linum trigynum]|uniref:Uncharacterized protein n=1 Tax=Linum trigynum TaxID=586398 RepID=A0AAV2D304_9ROSI